MAAGAMLGHYLPRLESRQSAFPRLSRTTATWALAGTLLAGATAVLDIQYDHAPWYLYVVNPLSSAGIGYGLAAGSHGPAIARVATMLVGVVGALAGGLGATVVDRIIEPDVLASSSWNMQGWLYVALPPVGGCVALARLWRSTKWPAETGQ